MVETLRKVAGWFDYARRPALSSPPEEISDLTLPEIRFQAFNGNGVFLRDAGVDAVARANVIYKQPEITRPLVTHRHAFTSSAAKACVELAASNYPAFGVAKRMN